MTENEARPDGGRELQLALWALAAMLTGYVIIPAGSVYCGAAPGGILRAAAGFAGVAAGIGIQLCGARRMAGSWREALVYLQLDKFWVRSAGRALWMAPALLLAAGIITALWMLAGTRAGIGFALPPSTRALSSGPWAARLLLAGSAVLLAPLFEELVFRRAIYGALAASCAPAVAAVCSALAFAAMHFSLLQLPGIWFLGWNWQRVVQKDGSLWSSVLLHAFNNLIAVSLILCWGEAEFRGNLWT